VRLNLILHWVCAPIEQWDTCCRAWAGCKREMNGYAHRYDCQQHSRQSNIAKGHIEAAAPLGQSQHCIGYPAQPTHAADQHRC
jgi:hypothetical protein